MFMVVFYYFYWFYAGDDIFYWYELSMRAVEIEFQWFLIYFN